MQSSNRCIRITPIPAKLKILLPKFRPSICFVSSKRQIFVYQLTKIQQNFHQSVIKIFDVKKKKQITRFKNQTFKETNRNRTEDLSLSVRLVNLIVIQSTNIFLHYWFDIQCFSNTKIQNRSNIFLSWECFLCWHQNKILQSDLNKHLERHHRYLGARTVRRTVQSL